MPAVPVPVSHSSRMKKRLRKIASLSELGRSECMCLRLWAAQSKDYIFFIPSQFLFFLFFFPPAFGLSSPFFPFLCEL